MVDHVADGPDLDHVLAASRFAVTEPISDLAGPDIADDPCLILARTIEREVIPRLLLRHRFEKRGRDAKAWGAKASDAKASDAKACDPKSWDPKAWDVQAAIPARVAPDVAAFCQIVLARDMRDASAHVATALGACKTVEILLLELFAPAARLLGELWESDECSFTDVTIALGKLQQLLRELSETYRADPDPKALGFRALLATVPTNQHVFGILIVEQLFRRSGWNVLSLPAPSRADLIDAVAHEWFAVVGLSIGCDASVAGLPALISDVRGASLNRAIVVLVGGRYVFDNPIDAATLGADLVGADAQEAILRSQDFLKSIGRP